MKSLIVYYSLSGNTANVAEAIADALSADHERIRDIKPRAGGLGYLRSAIEAIFKRIPKIAPPSKTLADYNLVILGCPGWGQNMASPMRAYLKREGAQIRKLALFCTEGGAGGEAVLRKMASFAGKPSIADLVVTEKDLKSGQWRSMVDRFARDVCAGLEPRWIGAKTA